MGRCNQGFRIIALGLLCAAYFAGGAQALDQLPGTHWKFTYQYTGDSKIGPVGGSLEDFSWATAQNVAPAHHGCSALQSYTETMSGTVTVTGTWVDDNGNGGTGAPAQSWFYVKSLMEWYADPVAEGYATLGSHAAADAFGDPEVLDQYNAYGISGGTHVIEIAAPSGIWTRDYPMSLSVTFTMITAHNSNYSEDGLLQVGVAPPADDYDFSGYPVPPPAGTTPHATTAANDQVHLSDGTAYDTLSPNGPHTSDTADHALQQLQQDSIFFVFGHGGSAFQSCQTFWNGTAWGGIVQTPKAGTQLAQQILAANPTVGPIAVLDALDANGQLILSPTALKKVLLAVFEGCFTSYSNAGWGDPVDGVIAHGALCALGWPAPIFSHTLNANGSLSVAGAEEWADIFWQTLQAGQDITTALAAADKGPRIDGLYVGMDPSLKAHRLAGPGTTKIVPAR
jgi:hypothetical protein